MSTDTLAVGTITWLVTFAVHSTILLGLAWLFAARLGKGAHRQEERWWKIALLAGILTASGQTALGIRPLTGELLLPATENRLAVAEPQAQDLHEPTRSTLTPTALIHTVERGKGSLESTETTARSTVLAPTTRTWVHFVVLSWLALAAFGLVRLALVWVQFQRRLRHRTPITADDSGPRGSLHRTFAQLRESAGLEGRVFLSASNQISSPMTFGLRRREICVPHAAVDTLAQDEQQAMLAHELAHARRRDPAWLLFLHVVERAFFFQPLLRVARQRQQHLAEYLCDDWAVTQTEDPVSLASCLTEVAGWVLGPREYRLASSMAASRLELETRVRRLLDARHSLPESRLGKLLLPCALASGLAVLFGVPAVTAEVRTADASGATANLDLHVDALGFAPSLGVSVAIERGAEVTPAALLDLLDAELGMLHAELEGLKLEIMTVEATPTLEAALSNLETRVLSLLARRERLVELLPLLSPDERAGSPAAQH